MEIPFFALAMLACPIGMGLMMWFMAKGMGMGRKPDPQPGSGSLAELHAERERIAAEIESVEGGESSAEATRTPSHA